MIVDIHTHIFPPEFIARREELAQREPGFRAIYGDPRAKMATADDLLASMDDAEVDVSVACGFWWSDPALATEHGAYIVDVAGQSSGRVVPFAPTFEDAPGAAGIGEVRLRDAAAFPPLDRPVLVHTSEDLGHRYPGKEGGLTPGEVWRLLEAQPQARVIAAHWGAGLPFFGLMPEVRAHFDSGRLLVDTAASAFLYSPALFQAAIAMTGPHAIAWGSDYPLRSQAVDLRETREAIAEDGAREAILGGNAARFLGLE